MVLRSPDTDVIVEHAHTAAPFLGLPLPPFSSPPSSISPSPMSALPHESVPVPLDWVRVPLSLLPFSACWRWKSAAMVDRGWWPWRWGRAEVCWLPAASKLSGGMRLKDLKCCDFEPGNAFGCFGGGLLCAVRWSVAHRGRLCSPTRVTQHHVPEAALINLGAVWLAPRQAVCCCGLEPSKISAFLQRSEQAVRASLSA